MMNHIYSKYIEARRKDLASYIEENIVDGDIPDKDGKRYIFLATNGSWQTKYISLFEMLHDKYIAKYCAKLLLDDYLEKYSVTINQILASGLTGEEIRAKLYEEVAFTKIVTVTVSSQLIGVALRNLIRDDNEKKYVFLRDPKESNRLKSCPELLRLSSYYSFDEEKPFKDISDKDKVIVVNDVISTGSLVYKISKKIKDKQAKLNAVFSIADTRVTEPNLLKTLGLVVKNGQENAIESHYIYGSEDEEELFFTLVKCNEQDHALRKYQRPYKGTAEVKRINPLLNTIVELETKHSEEKRVLFRKPENLINSAVVDESHFKVGHFRQNLSHNGYLTDMHNLFSTDGENSPGEKLLGAIKLRLDKFLNEQKPSTTIIDSILHNIELLSKEHNNNVHLINVSKEMSSFVQVYSKESLSNIVSFKPDYIFYPPFSGIEQLNESILNKYFGTSIENIVCLQRFDTNKGWRFPFPAKWYNHLTKDKSALVLDSGSLTGESLVQLVDSISFLDVKEITVLCAITRIEDFYREFYSRLKFSKVKTLQKDDFLTETEKANLPEHIIPLNIIFGVNLNIPVYPSKTSCPFCEELRDLYYCQEREIYNFPCPATKEYIESRIGEIKEVNLELLESYEIPSYFPKPKNTIGTSINSLELFLMRDRIGKIDSYRFYKDYFEYFDTLKSRIENNGLYADENLRDIENIMITILHEPQLFRAINDLLVDIKDYCNLVIVDVVINQSKGFEDLYFKWPKYSLVRLSLIFFGNKFYEEKNIERIFQFSLDDTSSLNYLSFLLWRGFFKIGTDKSAEIMATDILLQLSRKFDKAVDIDIAKTASISNHIYQSEKIRDIVKNITEHLQNTNTKDVNEAYYNLLKFFIRKSSKNTHDELSRFITRIAVAIQNKKTDDLLNRIYHDSGKIISILRKEIYDNLSIIKQAKELVKLHETNYEILFSTEDSIYSDFEKLFNDYHLIKVQAISDDILFNDYESKLRQVVFDIEDFQSKYLLKNKIFYDYVIQYRCDLIKCINEALSTKQVQNGIAQRTNFTCTPLQHSDLYINAHEELLTNAFVELFTNATSIKENDHSVLNIEILQESDTTVRLRISQHAAFVENKQHKGGYYKEVVPIFKIFGIKDSFVEIKQPSFIIEVSFGKQILKKLMIMAKIFTFVLTNHTDREFIDDFYELDNFINSTNAILLLRVNYFVNILNTISSDYSFRLVLHEGLRNRGGYSRSVAIIAELESAYPNFKTNRIVFLTREQDLFPNQELYIDDKVGRHINFNKCNIDTIVNYLPTYSKSAFISGEKSSDTIQETANKSGNGSGSIEFAILTALYEHEFAVYKSKCKLDSAHGVYNSYNAHFKEKIQLAHGVDYDSNFLVVHQEQMGLVDAAIHSTQVISMHDPTFVIMSGVCGGRKGQVNQYDVIIPTTVYDYATGKFKGSKLESLEYEASLRKELIKFLIAHNDKIVHNMRSLIDEDRKDLLSKDFKIVIGEFACGPWVVKTEGFLNKMAGEELTKYSTEEENKLFWESIPVNKINDKIKGLEMESYSILRAGEVIQKANHYSLVVKSVMDFTNEYKNDGQFKEIKSSASYVSFLCVRAMMPLLLDFKKNIEKWKK